MTAVGQVKRAVAAAIKAAGCAAIESYSEEPVSYTHLDVYKRQDRSKPSRLAPSPGRHFHSGGIKTIRARGYQREIFSGRV